LRDSVTPGQPKHRTRAGLGRRIDGGRRLLGRLGFGARLFLALALALLLVGAGAYFLTSDRLEQREIETVARDQQADVRGFEAVARESGRQTAVREIDERLDLIGGRPGTTEASLLDARGRIVASSNERLVGTTDDARQIRAALESGEARYGREADEGEDASDFEFVTPVDFPDRRYALEVSLDSKAFDEELAEVHGILLWIGLIALVAVAALFYLLGGRALLRSHRLALRRSTLDGLTDLPNQRAFQSEFAQAAAVSARESRPLALAMLDVDHFKLVNDRYGHPQGDALLQGIAAILRDGRSADRAYRIGGDEFALLLPNADVDGAETVVRRLGRTFANADISVSIGVAVLREGQRPTELRAEADAALYEAKRRGGRSVVGFDEIRGEVTVTTSDKREAVARLVDEGRLSTVFQPIWDFGSSRLIGMEALSRPAEDYGLSGPSEAFDVAAEAGLVHELDVVCATEALRSVSVDLLPAGASLFLNVAPKTLEIDAGEPDWLIAAVEDSELAPEQIVVEVTERMGSRVSLVSRSLARLRERGFGIALDDVGTGNAGLEMLRRVDADFVKIDRSVVAAAPTEPNARAVLLAMATFARQTGAFVIAEGIEDEETLAFLRSIENFDTRPGRIIQGGQGFTLGRPQPALPGALTDAAPASLQA
jgi:diguanylate cyclase (GGDEF)-like protein